MFCSISIAVAERESPRQRYSLFGVCVALSAFGRDGFASIGRDTDGIWYWRFGTVSHPLNVWPFKRAPDRTDVAKR